MSALFLLLLAGCGLAGVSYLVKVRQARTLSTFSEEEFLRLYQQMFPDPAASVLEQRQIVANHLGLPSEKLAPHQTFKQLAKYTGFVGEYEVGLGDLEAELAELFERASLKRPESFPGTIGELIHEMLTAKAKLPPGSQHS